MKPINKYLTELNDIVNVLLNDRQSSNPYHWDLLSEYHSNTSGAMVTNGVFIMVYNRPLCTACKDGEFQNFMDNFSNIIQLHKQKSKLEKEQAFQEAGFKSALQKYQLPVEDYLQSKKGKVIAFTAYSETHIVINKFTNKTFDNFMLETMLLVLPGDDNWKS